MTENYDYKVGGSLGENTPSYVIRKADSDLYHSLKAGEFCYIFNCRQMGKTSLIVRTIKKLVAEGFACTSVDFSVQGSRNINSEQWYAGIVYKLVTNFHLGNPSEFLRNWWRERDDITPVQRLEEFIETVLLVSIASPIIIFLDEIDSILSLSFPTDDFFALIRSCYEKRNFHSEYKRLTFALVGVATPGDLIGDRRRTPFNIGKAIQLEGFTESEIAPLAKGFEGRVENPLALVREILSWTGGQPFLTQKVCQLLQEKEIGNGERLESVIKSQIIENWEAHDEPEHLKTIRDRMLLTEQIAGRFLGWYQQILQSGYIGADDSLEKMRFRLIGLVVKQQNQLKVYNKIYRSVFDLKWVEKELDKLRPYSENFQAWVESNDRDESRLLRGQALQDALQWADGKSLSYEDSRYLAASQELEKRELEAALAVKEEESRILTKAQKKAKHRIRLGNIIFGISLIIAITLVSLANEQLQEARIVTELEKSSAQLFRLPKSSMALEHLIESMRSARELKKLVKNIHQLKDYPTITPLFALQTTLEKNIREKNRLSGRYVKFSPDSKIVATTFGRTAKLWNLKGELIATLNHQNRVNHVQFSSDGKTVATASDDFTAKLWNLKGEPIATLDRQNKVNHVEFSPDGKIVATASYDNTAKLWNLKGEEIATLDCQAPVNKVEFSPDGKIVATASLNNTAKLWNLKGEPIATLNHQKAIADVEFSADGKTVATASGDFTAKLWNLKGEEIATLNHQKAVTDVEFSPDGKTVATASSDFTAKLWNLKGEEIATLKHQALLNNVEFSPDGKTVATASWDKTAKLWNLNGEEIATLNHQALLNNVEFSPDGMTVATASHDGIAKLWNLKGEEIATLDRQKAVNNVEFSPDGKTVATASWDNTAKLWNLNGEKIATLNHQKAVNKVEFSPDGKTVATASSDNTAKLWNLKGEPITTLKHQKAVNDVEFSPDGKTVATASWDNTAKLWNFKGEEIATLNHLLWIDNVKFSPDGKTVATASSDFTAKLWNLKGEEIATLNHQAPVNHVEFSADGKIVATASWDNTSILWNLKGEEIATLTHQGRVNDVKFSTDGKTVATVSDDNTAKLWNLKGELIATLDRQAPVNHVEFSADGKTMATASGDNTVRLWTPVEDTWQQLAEYQGDYARFSSDGKLIAIRVDTTTVQLRRVESLDDLLVRGCNYLKDYLATRDASDKLRSEFCSNQ
ncbi:eIF2A-related protein [Scytonema sp. NUACC26]|uniref:eIF2A-related protein n=1 Tax=Scytonema sp. NUACC26 TaxID=3140176 RepID=UPI0034DBC1AB